ncbi:MAG: ABC transporter permease [Victivallaceae bacterium]|nr:ABC transporter permease [Victivallaceae bacterium]
MEILQSLKRRQFLFEELVKRDFRKKYKRTILGMGWSILSPLLTLLVMKLVFTQFFGRTMAHYTIYLFCGNLLFHYYRESTSTGMSSLVNNASIFTKINIPKYLFLFSHNVAALINFSINIGIFFIFCLVDRIDFSWRFFLLFYPVVCFLIFNLGVGLVLSALYVFFRDVRYLYDVFTLLLMYLSAIFYSIESFPALYQKCFLLNPVFVYISYFRTVVLAGEVPGLLVHALCIGYALVAFGIGAYIYKKYNHQFLYYV